MNIIYRYLLHYRKIIQYFLISMVGALMACLLMLSFFYINFYDVFPFSQKHIVSHASSVDNPLYK